MNSHELWISHEISHEYLMENTKENPMNISLPGLVNVYELERSTMLLGKSKRTFEAMASSSLKLLVNVITRE